MNVEFHYYTTWFLAVKAGFNDSEAARLAWACQYTDHHNRTLVIQQAGGTLVSSPTQNYLFWEDSVIHDAYLPFHFFPSLEEQPSLRVDGKTSTRDVRPNSRGVKTLLVEALKTRNLERIGIALHTFADSWAHQNFTAWAEDFNRLEANTRLPAPGHTQAGWQPDEWLTDWNDPRLKVPQISNLIRFLECAGKIYRYLCIFLGKEFRDTEARVLEELKGLVTAGRGRATVEQRMLELVIECTMEPYDRDAPLRKAVELPERELTTLPLLEQIRHVGKQLWAKTGLAVPLEVHARPGFSQTPFASWLRSAEDHRKLAHSLLPDLGGS